MLKLSVFYDVILECFFVAPIAKQLLTYFNDYFAVRQFKHDFSVFFFKFVRFHVFFTIKKRKVKVLGLASCLNLARLKAFVGLG